MSFLWTDHLIWLSLFFDNLAVESLSFLKANKMENREKIWPENAILEEFVQLFEALLVACYPEACLVFGGSEAAIEDLDKQCILILIRVQKFPK